MIFDNQFYNYVTLKSDCVIIALTKSWVSYLRYKKAFSCYHGSDKKCFRRNTYNLVSTEHTFVFMKRKSIVSMVSLLMYVSPWTLALKWTRYTPSTGATSLSCDRGIYLQRKTPHRHPSLSEIPQIFKIIILEKN